MCECLVLRLVSNIAQSSRNVVIIAVNDSISSDEQSVEMRDQKRLNKNSQFNIVFIGYKILDKTLKSVLRGISRG